MIAAVALFACAMLFCLISGLNLAFAILLGLVLFGLLGHKQGFTLRQMGAMAWEKGKKVLIVLRIFIFIGAITALWRSCGTIALFTYYGIRVITPSLFVLVAFLLTSLISFALGTSFGVIGTVGIILMTLARSGGVSEAVTAGAILSGAYFGDRCSPASSSASLVAAVTGTKLYDNLRAMLKTGVLPLAVTLAAYAVLSARHPIVTVDEAMLDALQSSFRISLWALVPAVLMLVLPLFKVPIRLSMGLSVLSAFFITLFVQHMQLFETLKAAVVGYYPSDGQLSAIISGGGILSMWKSAVIVFATGLLSGVLDGTGVLTPLQHQLEKLAGKIGLFGAMVTVSLGCGMTLCNQSIVVMMAQQMLGGVYKTEGRSREEEAVDIENSGIVLSAAIPWNIACSIPLAMLGVNAGAIPYAILLYMIPLCYGLTKKRFYRPGKAVEKERVA